MKAPFNAAVYAIDDGEVVQSRSDVGGYGGLSSSGQPLPGGAFIIRHHTRSGRTFYALYGHIKTDTLPSVGAQVKMGQIVARVGHYWYSDGSDVSHVHSGIMPDSLPSNPWAGYCQSRHGDHLGFVNPWHNVTIEGHDYEGFLDNNDPSGGIQAPSIWWTHSVAPDRFYNSPENLTFNINGGGDSNWTVYVYIDGREVPPAKTNVTSSEVVINIADPGMHDYTARVTNSVGEATINWHGGWDPYAPTVSQFAGPQPGHWSNVNGVSWACSDPLSGVKGFKSRLNDGQYGAFNGTDKGGTDLPEGKTTVWVQAEDNSYKHGSQTGNVGDTNLGEFWIDTVAPSAPGVSFNPPSPGGGIVNVTATSADGGSGVERIELWVNGQKIDSKAGGTVSFTWDANAALDRNTVRLVAFDYAGNSAATDATYDVDRSAPVALLTLTPSAPNGWNKWYKSVPTGALSASVPSGVASLYYQIGEGAWIKYASPFTIPGSGTVTVRYYAVSNAGVTGPTGETSIKIDATAPPTPSLQDEGAKTSSLTAFWMSILNPDPESGIGKIEYKVGDASLDNRYRDTTPIFTSSPFLLADGLWVPQGASVVIKARVFNGAGVASGWVSTDGIVADLNFVPFAVLSALNPVAAFAYELPEMIHWMTLGEPILGESTDGSNYSLTSGFWSSVLTTRVVGKVQLQDFNGDITKVPLTFEFRAPGGNDAVATVTVSPDSTGAIAIDLPLTGTYDVYVKAFHWLRAKRMTFALSDGDLGTFSLINGDINGDNQVTATDQALLSAAFRSTPGSPNWNPNADLNGDNQVTSTDQAILSKNFRKTGS